MIHSGQFIDIGTDSKSDVLATIADNCQKVSLAVWDIRKLEKIYDTYKIPNNEEIVAFCKGGIFGLTVSGMVFTDKAFYPEANANTQNRILYTDLCNFIITRQYDETSGSYLSNHGGVFLRNQNEEIEIFGSTIIARNIAAEEILKILIAIQKELCNHNELAKSKMKNMIDKIFNSYRNKMKHGKITLSDNLMLKGVSTISNYSESAVILLAENEYRLFDEDNLNSFLDHTPLKASIVNLIKTFSQNFINDLSNLNNDISKSYLEKVCSNIEKRDVEKLSEEENIIYILILMRLHRFGYAKQIIVKAKEVFGNEEISRAENILLIYGYGLMKKVYTAIIQGEKLENDLIDIYDGLGLTPLHYQLILNSDNVDDIIDSKKWSEDFLYLKNSPELTEIYDYGLLATIKHYSKLNDIFEYTDPKISNLKDNLIRLREEENSAAAAIDSIDKCLWDARRQMSRLKENGDFSAISNLKNSIEELDNSKTKAEKMWMECMQMISKLNDEIIAEIENKKHKILSNLDNLTTANLPLVNLLLELYENIDIKNNLKNILFNENQCCFNVYNYDGHSFLLPDNFVLNLPFYKIEIRDDGTVFQMIENSKEKENSTTGKLYGNSWFSSEAKTKQETLVSEYRKLVKIYHPDICQEEFASKYFVEITEEYVLILSNLK